MASRPHQQALHLPGNFKLNRSSSFDVVVNFGPVKIATSTLQETMLVMRGVLAKEHYCIVPGAVSHRPTIPKVTNQVVRCLIQGGMGRALGNCTRPETDYSKLHRYLATCATNGQMVMISSEKLSAGSLTGLKAVLRAVGFDVERVRLVFAYRRLTDWLTSMHAQSYKYAFHIPSYYKPKAAPPCYREPLYKISG